MNMAISLHCTQLCLYGWRSWSLVCYSQSQTTYRTKVTQCYYHDNEKIRYVFPAPAQLLLLAVQAAKPEWDLASFQGHFWSCVSAIFLHWYEIKSGNWWPGNEATNILPHVNYSSRLITRAHERPSYEADHNSLWLVSKTTWRSLI